MKLEIAGQQEKLLTVDERFIEGQITADSYHRLKTAYDKKLQELELRQQGIETTGTNFDKYVHYGLSLLTDLPAYYNAASLEVKQKLIGSICSGKFVYENGKYRTNDLNPAIALLQRKNVDYGAKKERTDSHFQESVLSGSAGRTRTYDPLINSQML